MTTRGNAGGNDEARQEVGDDQAEQNARIGESHAQHNEIGGGPGGGIVSGMSVGRIGGVAKLARGVPGIVAGHDATVTDLTDAIAFLLSEQASAISGAGIDVGCFLYHFHSG